MNSLHIIMFLLISTTIAINFARGSTFSNTNRAEQQIYEYKSVLLKNVNTLKDDINQIPLTADEASDIDSQFYTLTKKIETMRTKDEYEWAANKEALDLSYNDLVKNIHMIKSAKLDNDDCHKTLNIICI